MNFEEIKSAIMNLNDQDQKRLILEVVPAIWPTVCLDDICVDSFRQLVDEATVREYREQHLGSI